MQLLAQIRSNSKRIILVAIMIIIIAYSGLILYFYFNQDSMLFFPLPLDQKKLEQMKVKYKNVEDISIQTKDKLKINGWLVKSTIYKKAPLVLYYGGNEEEVSYLIQDAPKLNGWSLALINYRGSGTSQGYPGEKVLFEDALTTYDYFSKREDVDSKRIVIFGRSLGTGVAIYVAQNRPEKGVILATPYDSVVSVAQEDYPYLPVSLLLKSKFDSIIRAPFIRTPMLELVASNDEMIPPVHAKRLAEKWGGEVDVKVIKGETHDTIIYSNLYWKDIKGFLVKMQ